MPCEPLNRIHSINSPSYPSKTFQPVYFRRQHCQLLPAECIRPTVIVDGGPNAHDYQQPGETRPKRGCHGTTSEGLEIYPTI